MSACPSIALPAPRARNLRRSAGLKIECAAQWRGLPREHHGPTPARMPGRRFLPGAPRSNNKRDQRGMAFTTRYAAEGHQRDRSDHLQEVSWIAHGVARCTSSTGRPTGRVPRYHGFERRPQYQAEEGTNSAVFRATAVSKRSVASR
jgi:hypothetical protein